MKIIEASELPSEEQVYLKKDFLGWRVVHPIRNSEGKLNWFNFIFGSKSNLVFLIIIFILAVGFYLGINELINNYKLIADNPCKFCSDCQIMLNNKMDVLMSGGNLREINLSNLTWGRLKT